MEQAAQLFERHEPRQAVVGCALYFVHTLPELGRNEGERQSSVKLLFRVAGDEALTAIKSISFKPKPQQRAQPSRSQTRVRGRSGVSQ